MRKKRPPATHARITPSRPPVINIECGSGDRPCCAKTGVFFARSGTLGGRTMLKKGVGGGRALIHPFSGAGVFFALTGIRRGAKRGGGVDVITAYIDWGRTRTIPFACIHCNQIDVESSQTDIWCSAYSTYRFLSDANSNVGYTFRAIQNYTSTNHDLDLQAGSEI